MTIERDVVAEARRLMTAARDAGVEARVIGGTAVALHAANGLPTPLIREYGDIDLIAGAKAGRAALTLLRDLGYEPNERFNAMNGGERLVVYDRLHGRQIDVFVGEFRMCHRLRIAGRLSLDSETAPLAELLLTKLQVVQLNEKDLCDIYGLLVEHDVGEGDDETVNATFISGELAADWGLWRTSRGTLEAATGHLAASGLDAGQQDLVRSRIERLWAAVEQFPKPLRWRSRARVGDRMRWYEEPEEIAHGAAR